MDLVEFLSVSGASVIISGIFMKLFNRWLASRDERAKELEEYEQVKNDYEEFKVEQNDMNVLIMESLNETKASIDNFNIAMRTLLKDRIVQMYNHYAKNQKYMPMYSKESLETLFAQYHALGGNGLIDDLVKELRSLPTSDIEE